MKKLLLSLTILLFSQTFLFGQITSTTTGGNWSETSTWVGGVVPTSTDDVIIDGNIIFDASSECKNLTVNSENTINGNGWTRTLKVYGNLTNNGNFNVNNGSILLEIGGDFYLNGKMSVGSQGSIKINGIINQEVRYISSDGYNVPVLLVSELIGSTYQWYKDNSVITGATNQNLSLTLSPSWETADYKCVVDGNDSRIISLKWGEDSESSSTLNGKVTNAVDGTPISGALVAIGTLATTTDADGNYEITDIPAATLNAAFSGTPLSGDAPLEVMFTDQSNDAAHTVVISATGFSTYTNNQVIIAEGETLTMDASLSPTLTAGEMRIVLNWGSAPSDLDSYLKTPIIDGSYYSVYYVTKGSATAAPYATLDHDDQSGYGPETITIYQKFTGTYKYYIHKYSSGELATSNGVVQVYSDAGLVSTVNIPTTGTGDYWNVLTIDGATGKISVINEIVESSPTVAPPMPEKIDNSVDLAKLARGIQAITSWVWSFGDGATSEDQNPTHIYTSAGDYTVTLIASNGTDNATETKTNYISVSEGSTGGAIVSTTTGGLWNTATTWIGGIVPTATDDVIIDGTVKVDGYTVECNDLTVNTGKILTCNGNVRIVKAFGKIINNGIIQNNIDDAFYVEVLGNITNNGIWNNEKIRMIGTSDQTISGSTPYSTSDFAMGIGYDGNGQKLIAGSDVSFVNTHFYFNNSEFVIEDGKNVSFSKVLETDRGTMNKCHFIGGGTIESDSLFAFADSTSFDNVTLTGMISISSTVIMKENVKMEAKLQASPYWANHVLELHEDFTNDGLVVNDASYTYNLMATAFKNVTNNGTWTNHSVKMDGTSDQTFTNNNYLHTQFDLVANVPSATTFQWYKDGVAIDDVYASGEVYYYSKQASFEEYNPYGEYYCQTNAGNSRTISIIHDGSGEGDVILTENFDSETFPTNGWTQTIVNTANTWKKGNPESNEFTAVDPTNVYSALCPWVAADQDEWLNSPVVALPDDEILLEFYAGYGTDWLSSATMKLNISVDGGTNWTKIWEANNDGNGWQWRKTSIDLSSYKNNTNVKLGWQYVGNDGDLVGIDNVMLSYGTVGVEQTNAEIPTEFALNQNYPNPFNPSTIISYQLPKQGFVTLSIYNILGQRVAVLVNEEQSVGNYQFNFDASNLSTGTYIYQIKSGSFVQSKKMLLIK